MATKESVFLEMNKEEKGLVEPDKIYHAMKTFHKDGSIREGKINEMTNVEDILQVKLISNDLDKLSEVAHLFDIDLKPFKNTEDIEISSHYIDFNNQLTLNLSIPIGLSETTIEEESIHFIIKNKKVFTFYPTHVNTIIDQLTKIRYNESSLNFTSHLDFLLFQLGTISDYYADVVENISSKIRTTYYDIIKTTNVSDKNLDRLTHYNFSNFLVRESLSEFQKILLLLRRKYFENNNIIEKLELEINDLNVISEHVQYNFERVTDLKSNLNSKIELQQNKIFKTLTIITVCVSIPTLITGVYGMNFKNMPELSYKFGYPAIILIIAMSLVIPLIYFSRKKWF